jgi:hypothetical protein
MSTPLKYHTSEEKRIAINERSKKRYYDNLEKSREYQRAWQQERAIKNPEAAKMKSYSASIRRRYGLTVEQYDAKLAAQNNLCGLCGKPFEGETKFKGGLEGTAPVLDHDHGSGKLRDFVHRSCNLGIGYFYDDPDLLRLAAEYLERHTGGDRHEQERTTVLQRGDCAQITRAHTYAGTKFETASSDHW